MSGDSVIFTVPGDPSSWKRARRRGNVYYNDRKMVSEQDGIGWLAAAAMRGRNPYDGPVAIYIKAYFSIPSSWSVWKKNAAKAGLVRPTVPPDYDNIAKQIGDALTGIVWRDDRQIVDARGIEKLYGLVPKTEVRVDFLPRVSTYDQYKALSRA